MTECTKTYSGNHRWERMVDLKYPDGSLRGFETVIVSVPQYGDICERCRVFYDIKEEDGKVDL